MSNKFAAQRNQLADATARLREALAVPKDDISRDAVVQRFEFTFELAWKCARSYINGERPTKEVNSAADTVRAAADFGLIDDVKVWLEEYLDARNATSHTYNQVLAEKVYQVAKKFLPDVEDLLAKLREKS